MVRGNYHSSNEYYVLFIILYFKDCSNVCLRYCVCYLLYKHVDIALCRVDVISFPCGVLVVAPVTL